MAKYGKKASEKVARAMHERKRGTLRSGGSGRKVKTRKQAIAIGLSEARAAGGKVPARRGRTKPSAATKQGVGTRKRSRKAAGTRKSPGGKRSRTSSRKKSR